MHIAVPRMRQALPASARSATLAALLAKISEALSGLGWLLRLLVARGGTARAAAARSLTTSLAWLLAPLRHRRLRRFDNRYFVVRRWHVALAAAAASRALRWAAAAAAAVARRNSPTARALRARMADAQSFEEWAPAAGALDALEGRAISFPPRAVAAFAARAVRLRAMLAAEDVHGLMWSLRQDTSRDVGALVGAAAEARQVRLLAPPPQVAAYVSAVQEALHHVCHCPSLPLDERLGFVRELRHAYGRTGLVLSGGGSLGHWHYGINRELMLAGLLPRVMSGSSAGAIGCAMLCTRTDAEVLEAIDSWPTAANTDFFGPPKTWRGVLSHLFTTGTLHSHEEYALRLQRLLGWDLTFQEAYARSGRVLNIAVVAADTQEPCRVLNYLTAPHVVVWSAVACSSAFPLLFAPQELLVKEASGRIRPHHAPPGCSEAALGAVGAGALRRWCDGSLEEDLPMRGLGEMFGVNYFLCSQCNPCAIPLLSLAHRLPRRLAMLAELEMKHRCGQLLHLFPRSKLLKMVCQPWTGDMTFLLPLATIPMLRSAANFTPLEIVTAMRAGQRAVWGVLPALRAACAVELAVDAELRALTMAARAARRREDAAAALSSRIRASIPSWLDLKSLGLAHADSGDDVASLGVRTPRRGPSTERLTLAGPATPRGAGRLQSGGSGSDDGGGGGHGAEEMEPLSEPWETGGASGGGGGGPRPAAAQPERGPGVWRDLTALALGAEGIDSFSY